MESTGQAHTDIVQDSLSLLPDSMLHEIMSNLRTIDAAETMILSSRWKKLWATMPYFFLDDGYDDGWSAQRIAKFVNIVSEVLSLSCASGIHTFQLIWKCGFGQHGQQYLDLWTEQIVSRKVRIFELAVTILREDEEFVQTVQLPHCIFTCQSLEQLTLEVNGIPVYLRPPEFIMLRRLRTLIIDNIDVDCDSLRKLLSGCPVLEELEMHECKLKDPDISSNMLKRLEISNCYISGFSWRREIRISAPSLHTVILFPRRYHNDAQRIEVSFGNLASLASASIRPGDAYGRPVNFTTLNRKCILRDSAFSTFCNLKELTLTASSIKEYLSGVAYFLQRSPNLEQVTLQRDKDGDVAEELSYSCISHKMKILFQCGEENEKVILVVEELLARKCACTRSDHQSSSRS